MIQFAALLPLIMQGVGMAGDAANSRKSAAMQKLQGKAARRQAGVDAEAMSRDARQLLGRQAATIAQGGGAYEGTNARVMAQSEADANLDRLTTLYKGDLRKLGLEVDSDATMARAGTRALSSLSDMFGSAKRMPGGLR
jgi:hypothetical protein